MGKTLSWLKRFVSGKTLISRFLFVFFLSTFIAATVVGFFAYFAAQHRTDERLTTRFSEEADLTRIYIQDCLSSSYKDILFLSYNPYITSPDISKEEKWLELRKTQLANTLFEDITLISPSGVPLMSTSDFRFANDIGDPSGTDVFKTALTGRSSMSDAQTTLSDPNRVIVLVAAPVFKDNNLNGILIAQMNMQAIWQFTDRVKIGNTGYIAIVNGFGRYIAHPDKKMLFQPIASQDVSNEANSIFSYNELNLVDVQNNIWVEGDKRTGLLSERITNSSILDKGWRVMISQESSEVYSPINETRWMIIGGFITVIVFFLIIGVFMGRWLSKPMRQLAEGTQRIALGDFTHRLDIKRNDELGDLARAYNDMAGKLEHRETEREYLQLLRKSMILWVDLSGTLSLEKFLSDLPEAVMKLFECDSVWLFLVRGQYLEGRTFCSNLPEVRNNIKDALGRDASQISFNTQSDINLFTQAFASRRPIFLKDASVTEQNIVKALLGGKSGTAVALPLIIGDECKAVLGITQAEPFAPGAMEIMFALAQHSAVAMENALLYEAARRQTQEKTRLYEMAGVMSSSLEFPEVLDRAIDGVMSLLPSSETAWVIISSFDAQTSVFNAEASRNLPSTIFKSRQFKLDEEVRKQLAPIFTGRLIMFRDIKSIFKEQPIPERLNEVIKQTGMKSWLVIPLMVRGRMIGTLLIINTLPILPSDEQIEALRNLANNIAVAMENARLYAIERERVTKLHSLEQLKTDFMLAISHELKTPLTSLSVSAGLLKEELTSKDDTHTKRLLTGMVNSVERLNRLVSDLLEAARLENSVVELDLEHTDVLSTIKAVITTFAPMMESKGQQFTAELPSDGLWALTDLQRLEQLVTNLLSNAQKFTPAGGQIKLTVKEEGKNFILKVSDTGPGIPEDEQKRIFEPFYRAKGMPRHTGTGLGLTIARRLTELLGGTLSVESHIGRGSTFTIVLPKGVEKRKMAAKT